MGDKELAHLLDQFIQDINVHDPENDEEAG
jgi:hypothetical protein